MGKLNDLLSSMISSLNQKSSDGHLHATSDLSDIDDFNQNLATTYAKKTELPTIPTKVSAFENDKGYLTEHQSLEEYAKRDELPVVPTNVSAFTNDKGYLTEETDPTVPKWAKEPNRPTYTAADVGADAKDTASNLVSAHNTGTGTHSDIRLLIKNLTDRLDAVANSTDDELDQLSEIVAYIKSNKSLIDSITTSKVNVSDIVNNLTTNVTNKPLSAKQGVVLKALIDAITVPTKVSQLENDKGYLTQHQDLSSYAKKTDIPTVPTALSQLSQDSTHRVVTDTEKSTWNAKSNFSGSYNDLTNKPTIPSAYSHPSSHPASMITGLATVATSGSYNDLSNKPTIPSAYTHPSTHPVSMITGLSTVATSGKYSDLSGKPTIPTVPSSLPANGGNADTVDSYHIAVSSSAPTTNNNKIITFVV